MMPEMLTCDFCGCGVENTAEANAWFGVIPYPGDIDHTGMCRGCGGDPEAKATRKRLGWVTCTIVDARIPIIRGALSPANRCSFEKMNYEKKAALVAKMMEKGLII